MTWQVTPVLSSSAKQLLTRKKRLPLTGVRTFTDLEVPDAEAVNSDRLLHSRFSLTCSFFSSTLKKQQ